MILFMLPRLFFFFTSYVPEYVLDSNLIFTLQLLNMTCQFFIGSNWKMNDSAAQVLLNQIHVPANTGKCDAYSG